MDKKKILKRLIIILLLNSSFITFSQNYDYSESVNFRIDEVRDVNSLVTGHQSWVYPNRGNKFVLVTLSLMNESNTDINVDFDKFNLINPKNKTKHKAEFVRTSGLLSFPAKIILKLKKNKIKQRTLVFIFPENDKAEFMTLNDSLIELLKYEENSRIDDNNIN